MTGEKGHMNLPLNVFLGKTSGERKGNTEWKKTRMHAQYCGLIHYCLNVKTYFAFIQYPDKRINCSTWYLIIGQL